MPNRCLERAAFHVWMYLSAVDLDTKSRDSLGNPRLGHRTSSSAPSSAQTKMPQMSGWTSVGNHKAAGFALRSQCQLGRVAHREKMPMFPGSTCLFSRPRLLQLHVARNCKESLGWGDYMALPRLQLVKCTLEGLQTEHANSSLSSFWAGPRIA